nr:hypothetical protein B0A51_17389 [Rachicladosporium sp. CCFEE 5018]
MVLLKTSLLFAGVATAQYEQYILAPSSRTLHPATVNQINDTVNGADSLTGDAVGSATFDGVSGVTYDFGKNIAGLVSLQVGNVDDGQFIGLTYTESSLWISHLSSDATEDSGMDEPVWFQPQGAGNVSVGREHERGGFRYLTLVHNTTGSITIEQITVHFTPLPNFAEDQLNNYTGYFHCNDELLNRIWYAGAYTNQMCTIDPHHGNSLVYPSLNSSVGNDAAGLVHWYNNYTIANASSVLTDGAKRDRLVWPGDMAIAVPSIVVSYYDLVSVRDSLDSLYKLQNTSTGQMPYAGTPFNERGIFSFTYHLYSLIAVADYYLYSADLSYAADKWEQYKFALKYSLSTIDDSGMMNVTSSADWLRFGMGGHNIEANAILYYTINQAISLGQSLNEEQSVLDSWTTTAAGIKSAANTLLWNATAGLYKDNETTTLFPQDGNTWAIFANLTDSSDKNVAISNGLAARWTPYGAPAVEADNAVSPFISSFELQAHFLAGNASAALALTRLQWGFMMDDPRMTNSTFIEGYQADGVLHYAPYKNDPRISHAHGWATGPTSTLTFYVAGIHLLTSGGETWEITPSLADLTFVDAGFSTNVGSFASQVNASTDGSITGFTFTAPEGTTGRVSLPGVSGSLVSGNGTSVALVGGKVSELSGGIWTLKLSANGTFGGNGTSATSSPVPYTGAGVAVTGSTVLSLVAAVCALMW